MAHLSRGRLSHLLVGPALPCLSLPLDGAVGQAVVMAVMTQAQIASLLGVSRNVVHMWHRRRRTSGFPSAVGQTIVKHAPLFDVDQVVDWYSKKPQQHGLPDPRTVKRNPRSNR